MRRAIVMARSTEVPFRHPVIGEIEWAGTIKGSVLESGEDRAYRCVGLGLIDLRDGRIARQVLFADFTALAQQLRLTAPAW